MDSQSPLDGRTTDVPAATPTDAEHEADEAASPQPIEALRQDDFTELAWSMLQVARRLGEGRPGPGTVSLRRLLASMLLSGLSKPEYEHTGTWLVSHIDAARTDIRSRLASHYPKVGRRASFESLLEPGSGDADTMTVNLQKTLELARRLAVAGAPPDATQRIGARHLLGAAVRKDQATTNVGRFLQDFGLEVDRVRTAILSSLRSWDVPDQPNAWLPLLDPITPDELGARLPTYAADSATGPDWIGITRDVEAMASLVSAWAIEPPLSIGLFGEWGSGKTFFMQKMKERIRMIASEARKAKVPQKDFGYYRNIVQVEFNAWHYVEGNLWASLVEHIFTNLKLEGIDEPDIDSEAQIEKRLQTLLGEVQEKAATAKVLDDAAQVATKVAMKAKEEADQRARDLEAQADTARTQANQADVARAESQRLAEEAQRTADAKAEERRTVERQDLIEAIKDSDELRANVRAGLEQVGITRERLETVEDLRAALREASDAGTLVAQAVRILKSEPHPWRLLLWVLLVPGLCAATTLGVAWLARQQDAPWVQSVTALVTALSAVPAFLVGAWRRYGPRLKPLLDTVEDLKRKRAELEARVEVARRARSEEAAALDREADRQKATAEAHRQRANEQLLQAETGRREAAAKQAEAAAMVVRAGQAQREVSRLEREADLLRPERRIATFILDRASAKDYRRYLGVPAIIRRDFEKLAAMFRTQRIAEETGRDGGTEDKPNDLAIVNRIILYIDDLDRCPPRKVVEVLQAIHLLLAFPLFVVVVAVDARWMKRSLKDQFSLMLAGSDGLESSREQPPREQPDPGEGQATPDDYLEKIFQVPFWIRPLGVTATENLVRELTKNDLVAPRKTGPDATGDAKRTPDTASERTQAAASSGAVAAPPSPGAVPQPNQASGAPATGPSTSETRFSWSPIEPKPRTLQISEDERAYMVSLATIIGRSPRAVKRFVNCYRLVKATSQPEALARQSRDGTFRATMLLLAIVSGLPEIAPKLLTALRAKDADSVVVDEWLRGAGARLGLGEDSRWKDLLPMLEGLSTHGIRTIAPLVAAANHVDRFAFNPVRTTAAGPVAQQAVRRTRVAARSRASH
jgi:KAP family P-loop domain